MFVKLSKIKLISQRSKKQELKIKLGTSKK